MYGQTSSANLLMGYIQKNPWFKPHMQITPLIWSDTDRIAEGSSQAEGGMVDLTIMRNTTPRHSSHTNCLIYGPQNVSSICLLTTLSEITNLSDDIKQRIVGIMRMKSPGSDLHQIPKSIEGKGLEQILNSEVPFVRATKEDSPAVSSKIMVLVDSDIGSEKDPDFYLNFYSYRNSLLVIQIAEEPARMVFLEQGTTKIGFPGAYREHTIVARTSRSAEGKINTRREQLTESDKKKTGIVCVTIPLTRNKCISVEEINLLSKDFDRYNSQHGVIQREMELIRDGMTSIETEDFSEMSNETVRELYRNSGNGTVKSDFELKEGGENTYFVKYMDRIQAKVRKILQNFQEKIDAIAEFKAQIEAVTALNIALKRNHWVVFKELPLEDKGLMSLSRQLDLTRNNLNSFNGLDDRKYKAAYDNSVDEVFPRHRSHSSDSDYYDDDRRTRGVTRGGGTRGGMFMDSDDDDDQRTRGGNRSLASDDDGEEEKAPALAYTDLQMGIEFSELVPAANLNGQPLVDMNIDYSLPIRVDEITVVKVEYNQGQVAAERVLLEYNKGLDDDKLNTLAENSDVVRRRFKTNKYACPE